MAMKIPFNQGHLRHLTDSEHVSKQVAATVAEGYEMIVACLKGGGTVFTCGNGGSMADSCHFAAELTGRFRKKDRPPLRGLALGTNPSEMSAIANDFGYEQVFVRPLSIFAKRGDVLVGFSTSGTSPNVVRAWNFASTHGMGTIALTGEGLVQFAKVHISIPSDNTARIQELHQKIYHLWCENLDEEKW